MIAVCTGISGVGKREYLRKVLEAHPEEARLFDVGEMMLVAAKELNIDITTERILDMPESTLTALRSTVFERILPKLDDKHCVISLHASFRWKQVLSLGFNAYYLKKITDVAKSKKIEVAYICFTDTACNILARLQQRLQWKDKLSLEEILLWSDEEAALTRMIAEYEQASYFVLPSAEPLDSFWNLLANPSKKKLYLSFPITHVKKQPKVYEEVVRFREALRKEFVVFDPLAVQDIEWVLGVYAPPDALLGSPPIELPKPSPCAKSYMEGQTVSRDFQLVDQSDFVVVYYKTDAVSFGVISEMIHGYSNNKPVYAVWDASVSPFFANYCTLWKPNTEQLLSFLLEKYK